MNYVSLSTGIATWITGLSGMRVVDLFATSFVFALIGLVYFFLANFWTANITNKMIIAKLLKRRIMPYFGEDNVLRLFIANTGKGFWSVAGLGSFKVNKDAMGWLPNGTLIMPCVHGHAEGVNIEEIKQKNLLYIDPEAFERRIENAKMEAVEEEKKPVKVADLMAYATIILIIGIVAYLVIGQLQTGECQSQLVSMAKSCGEPAKAVVNATAEATHKAIISGIKDKV
jgi:hypothetical protein